MTEDNLSCPLCVSEQPRTGPYRGLGKTVRRVPLAPHDYEAGIMIQRCQQCDGLWLEDGQLRAIQDAREHDYQHSNATDVVLRHRRAAVEREPPPDCPRCAEPMWPSTFKTSGIPYESCLGCGGTWIRLRALQDVEAFWESMMRP